MLVVGTEDLTALLVHVAAVLAGEIRFGFGVVALAVVQMLAVSCQDNGLHAMLEPASYECDHACRQTHVQARVVMQFGSGREGVGG